MAIYDLLTWRGPEGLGASPAPDRVLLDWWHLGSDTIGNVAINDSAIELSTASRVTVVKGSSGVTDELATINGGNSGAFIWVINIADITAKHGTGNIKLAGGADFYMDFGATQCTLTLLFDGTNWLEVSRATDIT
jgi:hypothetical protein